MRRVSDILKSKYIVLAIFSIAAFITYFSSTSSPFHFDDLHNIIENPNVTVNELSYPALKKAALTRVAGLRPVSYLSFAVNYFVSGQNTTSYHAINIMIHIVNAFLIYLIILRLFSSGDDDSVRLCAFFTALVWLMTPLNSQAVISIVQRMTLLMTLFFLLAFLCYIIAKEKGKIIYYTLCGLFFILSLLSKQNGGVFPLVIIIYELTLVKRGDLKSIGKRELTTFALLAAALIVMLFLYKDMILKNIAEGYQVRPFTMSERVLTQFRVLVFYLTLIILPLPGRLSITHDIAKSTSIVSPVTTLFSFALLAALLVIAIVRMKKSPYLSFALLWFFVTMSVESTIIPLEMAYEHRMYLPGIFLFGYVIDYVIGKARESKSKIPVIIGLLCVAFIFSAMTAVRGKAWNSSISIWSDVLEKYPDDPRGLFNLGNAYSELKMHEEAEKYLMNVIEREESIWVPHRKYLFARAYNNLGIAKLKLKRDENVESYYYKAIEYDNEFMQPYSNLGSLYYTRKDYSRSIGMFNTAIKIGPETNTLHDNIAEVYRIKMDFKNAIRHFERALKLNPSDSVAYNGIGGVYGDMGDYKKASHYFNKALEHNPENETARRNLKILESLMNK